jgi:hypothetical protein
MWAERALSGVAFSIPIPISVKLLPQDIVVEPRVRHVRSDIAPKWCTPHP